MNFFELPGMMFLITVVISLLILEKIPGKMDILKKRRKVNAASRRSRTGRGGN